MTALDERPVADLRRSLWWVALAMSIHELEEWKIGSWFERNFDNYTPLPDAAIWIGLGVITTLFVGWIYIATRFQNPVVISALALPLVGVVAVGNAVQHITWTVLFASYAPGVYASALLVLPTSALALWRMIQADRRFAIPVAACGLLWVGASLQVIGAGRTLQPFQLQLQAAFRSLAQSLGL